jgi:hypothetical protein
MRAETALYFLTGSSASGKTTLLREVARSAFPALAVRHFDDLGTPTREEMDAQCGGPAQWQDRNIRRWLRQIADSGEAGLHVLDGQAKPNVVLEAARECRFPAVRVVLITCSHEERRRRLRESRIQPELDAPDMYAWAAYLHGQADALGLEVIDTTGKTAAESARELALSIRRFAEEEGIPLERRRPSAGA